MSKSIEDVYAERNRLALAVVSMARQIYGRDCVGRYVHDDPDWPVVYADLPNGQVSWHLPAEDVPEYIPERSPDVYDGHGREEKKARLDVFASRFWFDGDLHLPDGGSNE